MKNSSYYIAPVGDWTHDLPHTVASNMLKVSHALNHSATEAVEWDRVVCNNAESCGSWRSTYYSMLISNTVCNLHLLLKQLDILELCDHVQEFCDAWTAR